MLRAEFSQEDQIKLALTRLVDCDHRSLEPFKAKLVGHLDQFPKPNYRINIANLVKEMNEVLSDDSPIIMEEALRVLNEIFFPEQHDAAEGVAIFR